MMPPRASLPQDLRKAVSSKMKRNEAVVIVCPYCEHQPPVMTFKRFREEHMCQVHHLDPKRECVFCGGRFHWEAGQKGSHSVGAHLFQCLNTFLREYKAVSNRKELSMRRRVAAPREMKKDDRSPLCECVSFDSPSLAFDLSGRTRFCEEFYQPLSNEKPVDFWYKPRWGDVAFQPECGLGREAAGMIRMQRSGRWTFYHLFLRPCVIRRFNEVMTDPKLLHHVAVSPFGCLCDGMRAFDEEAGRHHRHVLVATDLNAAFAQACTRVRCDHRKHHTVCQRKYKIVNTGHLISAIRYVSSPESHCGRRHAPVVRDPCMAYSDVGETNHHYYISRPMHRHAIVAMSVLYPGGLRWLAYKHNSGKKITRWNYQERRLRNGTWKYSVRLGDTGIQMQNCVLRWAKDLELVGDDDMPGEDDGCEPPYIPVDDESEDEGMEVEEVSTSSSDEVLQQSNEEKSFRIFLINTSRHLRSNPALSQFQDHDWLMHQAKNGNRFLKCVEDEEWPLSKQQAHTANEIREVKEKMSHEHKEELREIQETFRKLLEEQLRVQNEQLKGRDEEIRRRDEQLRAYQDLHRIQFLFLMELVRQRSSQQERIGSTASTEQT